jgi:hypothetical protein
VKEATREDAARCPSTFFVGHIYGPQVARQRHTARFESEHRHKRGVVREREVKNVSTHTQRLRAFTTSRVRVKGRENKRCIEACRGTRAPPQAASFIPSALAHMCLRGGQHSSRVHKGAHVDSSCDVILALVPCGCRARRWCCDDLRGTTSGLTPLDAAAQPDDLRLRLCFI